MSGAKSQQTKTRPSNVPALERATGISWETWVDHFAAHDAATKSHTEIAQIARTFMPGHMSNPDWWAQGAAIAYEQFVGIRIPGQSSTGEYRVNASRTVTGDRDATIDTWAELMGELPDHLGFHTENERRSRTDKRTFWRVNLDGAGKVEVSATPKGDDKVIIDVSHSALTHESDIEIWRSYWKEQLTKLNQQGAHA